MDNSLTWNTVQKFMFIFCQAVFKSLIFHGITVWFSNLY